MVLIVSLYNNVDHFLGKNKLASILEYLFDEEFEDEHMVWILSAWDKLLGIEKSVRDCSWFITTE